MNKPQKTPRLLLESIPSVHKILDLPDIRKLVTNFGQQLISEVVRQVQEDFRSDLIESGGKLNISITEGLFVEKIQENLSRLTQSSIKPLLNLSGTILHTNLGRALLPKEAVEAMTQVATQASNLEFNVEKGGRDNRDEHVEEDLCHFTGSEAACIVNNNAAAVMLILNTLARRKEVIISRGELVEIGGLFRLPDIMKAAGCKLKEVGTTNRTYLKDFEDEVSVRTGLIFKAYTSNYNISGFTKEVRETDLVRLGKEKGVPFVVDVGSGSLTSFKDDNLTIDATPLRKIQSGVHLVTFSGDKLIGGPQCGIIAGRKDLIAKINKNPMKRAMRCDKITISALSAVLKLYRRSERAKKSIPTLRLIFRSKTEIKSVADRILPLLKSHFNESVILQVIDCYSQVGSGSLPGRYLPSAGVSIRFKTKNSEHKRLNGLANTFRSLPLPIIGRIHENSLIFDFRCLEDEKLFINQLEFLPRNLGA